MHRLHSSAIIPEDLTSENRSRPDDSSSIGTPSLEQYKSAPEEDNIVTFTPLVSKGLSMKPLRGQVDLGRVHIERAGGRGLPSMKARAASLGASFELSGGPAGTRLVLGLPLYWRFIPRRTPAQRAAAAAQDTARPVSPRWSPRARPTASRAG